MLCIVELLDKFLLSLSYVVVVGLSFRHSHEVVIGGTHMVSRFCRSWWVALGVRILSFVFPESIARMGLVHLVLLVDRLFCVSHWGGKTGSPPPSPTASSSTTAGTSEEEGLHTTLFLTCSRWPSCSTPGTSEEEGLAPLLSSSHCRYVPRRERDRAFSLTSTAATSEEEDRTSSSH